MATTIVRKIPDELWRRAKAFAAIKGVSLNSFVIAAIEAVLDEHTDLKEWQKQINKRGG